MANEVYTGSFKDYGGVVYTVYIFKDGYTDPAQTVTFGAVPVTIKHGGGNDDKFKHILTSECYIELLTTTPLQFLSLFLEPVKTYQVEIYRGATQVWRGWVNPEYYEEPFTREAHVTTLHCVDGLAELKNVDLPVPGATIADMRQTAIYWIHSCLSQIPWINSDSGFQVCLGLVAAKYDETVIPSRLLENIYFDFRAFHSDTGEVFSCFDTLEEILSSLGARLYMNGDYWRIERLDHKRTDFVKETYSTSGVYSASATINEVMRLTPHTARPNDFRFKHGASLEIQPAYKSFDIEQDYGRRDNVLPFTTFTGRFFSEEWNAGALRYWTEYNSVVLTYEDEWEAVRIGGYFPTESGLSTKYIVSDKVEIETGYESLDVLLAAWADGDVILKFEFVIGAELDALTDTNLVMNFSGNDYSLDQDTATASVSDATLKTGTGWMIEQGIDKGQWRTVTMTVRRPPADEIGKAQTSISAMVTLYQAIYKATTSGGVVYKSVRLWFENGVRSSSTGSLSEEGERQDWKRTLTTPIDTDNIIVPDAYPVKFGNIPAAGAVNAYGLMYKSVIFDEDGKAITGWGYTGDTGPVGDLITLMLMTDLYETYKLPLCKLKGTLIDSTGTFQGFSNVLEDYDNRNYIPLSLSWQPKDSTFEGDWLQIGSSCEGEFDPDEFSDEFYI